MSSFLTSDGARLNFIRTGPRGGSPVVLLHAVGTDLTLWGPQIEALEPNYDVVAVDLPGHGLSARPAGEPSFTTFAALVRQLLERLAAGPVHLVGISFGGMVAQTVALEHPALVRSLSLIGTACTFPEGGRAALRERARFVREQGMPALAPLSLARWFSPGFSARRPDVLDRVAKMLYQQEPSFHAALWDVIAALDTQPRLAELALSALVIVGAEDASTPVSAAHALAQALGTASVHAIPNASHFANLEAPEAVNALLQRFLGSLS